MKPIMLAEIPAQVLGLGWTGTIKIYQGELPMYAPESKAAQMPMPREVSPLDRQVGGNHYKDKAIQPVEYIHANGLGFIEGSIVKYITRWRDKNGLEDLQKIKHYVDLLIDLETRNEQPK